MQNGENFKLLEGIADKKMKISRELDIKVMPTTLLINREIQEISRVTGYIDWKNEEIINLIKKLI